MEKDFSFLVSKTLSGEADEQEKQLLREMLRDSETDASLYDRIREYWDADVEVDETLSAETQKRILEGVKTDKINHSRRDFALKFYRAAAVILLAIVGGAFYYHTVNQQNTYTYATQNAIADYVLQDGTKIKLNKNSSVTFTSAFGRKNRKVDLTGEAYFEVQKDKSKPFSVHTQGAEIRVLGTSFNVLSDESEKQVTVALVEGSVRFKAEGCDNLLRPEEEIVYHTETREFEKQITDLQFNTAWTEGRYFYRDIAFGDLLKKLEHIYGVRIEMDYPEIATKRITTSFLIDRPLQEILAALQDELKFNIEETGEEKMIIQKINESEQ
ncbi:MAG: FecR domain-containing protein [Tannerella sp.]|jgi:ferric-dicitrate binding protein FerR (iron transport regulator)|nr:FecR domain-containing protein [Tannerella sp.]